jgi:hypothetical protein
VHDKNNTEKVHDEQHADYQPRHVETVTGAVVRLNAAEQVHALMSSAFLAATMTSGGGK